MYPCKDLQVAPDPTSLCAKLRPLLLVDVDGVISLFGFVHASPPSGHYQLVDGITHFLSGAAADHLRRLSEDYELVWCTGWEEKANEYLPLALGLPAQLPHLVFDPSDRPTHAHWKLAAIERHAGRAGRWPGSTTPTTTAAGRGRPRGRLRRCWSPPTRRSA